MAARRMATCPTTRRMTKATVTSAAPPVKGMEDASRRALRVPGTRMNLCVHRRARVIVSSGCGRKDRREGGRKEDEAFRPVKAARLAGDASIKKSSRNNGEPTDRSYRSQEVQTDPVEVCCALRYCEECVHSDAGIWTQGACCSWFEKYTAVRRENRVLRTDLQHDRVEFGKVDRHLHRVQMSRFFKIEALNEARDALDFVAQGRGRKVLELLRNRELERIPESETVRMGEVISKVHNDFRTRFKDFGPFAYIVPESGP